MALFVVTIVATTAGAFLYIKSDYMRGKIAVATQKIKSFTKKLDRLDKSDDKQVANLQQKLAKQETTHDGYEDLGKTKGTR